MDILYIGNCINHAGDFNSTRLVDVSLDYSPESYYDKICFNATPAHYLFCYIYNPHLQTICLNAVPWINSVEKVHL